MTLLKRYRPIISAFWQRGLTYRSTILAYRFGEIAELLILVLLWIQLFEGQTTIQGYTKPEMITYLLVGSILGLTVRNYARDSIMRDIRDGGLSALLIKPMSYFKFLAARELGRLSLPTLFSVSTGLLTMVPFLNLLLPPASLEQFLILLCMVFLALFTEICISALIAFITFWTEETEAIFDVISRLKRFFSGGYFPLSLMPAFLLSISRWLPFGYSFFVPMQLYLGKMTVGEGMQGLGIQVLWIVILYTLVRIMYARGVKRYEGINM